MNNSPTYKSPDILKESYHPPILLCSMSTDHGVTGSLPSGPKENQELLREKQADYVVIAKVAEEVAQSKLDNGDRIIIKT